MASQTLNLYFKSLSNPLPIGQFFVYDSGWLSYGYSLSRDLPLIPKVFKTDSSHPVFGFMYDLIPGIGARKATKFIYKKDLTNNQLFLLSQEVLRPGAVGFKESTQLAPVHLI